MMQAARYQVNSFFEHGIWQGGPRPWRGLLSLLWMLALFAAFSLLWGMGVELARYPEPGKQIGLGLAVLGTILGLVGVMFMGRGMMMLGLRRLLIVLAVVFLLAALFGTLTAPGDQPLGSRLGASLLETGQNALLLPLSLPGSLIERVNDFRFAYSGVNPRPPLPPGFPTPDPDLPPIVLVISSEGSAPSNASAATQSAAPQPEPTQAAQQAQGSAPYLHSGGFARVVNTGGQTLRGRAGPGTNYEVTAKFSPGERLQVLDGPTESGGYTWWQVRGDSGEGWSADDWLEAEE
jgi:hypothetical protein